MDNLEEAGLVVGSLRGCQARGMVLFGLFVGWWGGEEDAARERGLGTVGLGRVRAEETKRTWWGVGERRSR